MQSFSSLPKEQQLQLIQAELVRRELERRGLSGDHLKVSAVTGSRVEELRGVALELQSRTDSEIVITGPAGTGKSIGIFHKLHTIAENYENVRILVLRLTRVSLTESGMVTFEEKVLPENHPVLFGSRGTRIDRKNRSAYYYPSGSTIVMGGMDEPTRLFSTEYDIIYWQECNEGLEDQWQSLLRALRNNKLPFQQLIGDCNPDVPTHWIKMRAQSGELLLLESTHHDNPTLWDAVARAWTVFGVQYIGILDKLKGSLRERLRFGRWVAAEGAVYEEFTASVHVINPFPIPRAWAKYRVIDFGFTNPFVCQWWAVDPDGILYLYRELYRTKIIVQDHAEIIKEHSKDEQYVLTLADHDAEDRATLEKEGISTRAANKAVTSGIQNVKDRLKVLENGKARLYIFRHCLIEADPNLLAKKVVYCTEMEFGQYAYPKDASGKPVKEQPVKEFDHGMDAMRYIVNHLDALEEGDGKATAAGMLAALKAAARR
jgi:PBSX family phage terminase large subunit